MLSNGSLTPEGQQQEEPPTIENLTKQIQRLNQYLELFRQQRDNANQAVSNLQCDLALAQHQIKEYEDNAAKNAPASARLSNYPSFEEGNPN